MLHTLLPNGCRRSPFKVHPKNWQNITASVREDWYVWYRFHDPAFKDKYPKGKLIKKQAINGFKTATERRAAAKAIINDLRIDLEEKGYNPITGLSIVEPERDYEISPDTPLVRALEQAAPFIKCEHSTMLELKRLTKHFGAAADKLRYGSLPVSEIKRKHIRYTLDHMEREAKYWSGSIFNHYRRSLSMLFSQLLELEAIEYNPIVGLKKAMVTKKRREVITDEQRPKMAEALSKDRYEFWRYLMMFFHSGARNTEMLRLQASHVNLQAQEVKYLVKKGRQYAEVIRPIKDIALHYWTEIMSEAKKDDYLFSRGLKPGPGPIRPDQIKRRWRTHVKDKLGVTATQYSLKHMNSDEISAALDTAHAARLNAHTSDKMVKETYAVNEGDRQTQRIKTVRNEFVKAKEKKE